MSCEGNSMDLALQSVLGRGGGSLSRSIHPHTIEGSVPTPVFSEAPLRTTKAIKAPLCVSGEAEPGAVRGAPQRTRSCVFANRGAELCRGAESSNCL